MIECLSAADDRDNQTITSFTGLHIDMVPDIEVNGYCLPGNNGFVGLSLRDEELIPYVSLSLIRI
jgi:hypothetical protein